MKHENPIEEIWRIRDELSAEYGYDVHRIFAALREEEKNTATASFEWCRAGRGRNSLPRCAKNRRKPNHKSELPSRAGGHATRVRISAAHRNPRELNRTNLVSRAFPAYGTSSKPSPTCSKCRSSVRIRFNSNSCMTTIDVKSVNEISGLSLYFTRSLTVWRNQPQVSTNRPAIQFFVNSLRQAAVLDPANKAAQGFPALGGSAARSAGRSGQQELRKIHHFPDSLRGQFSAQFQQMFLRSRAHDFIVSLDARATRSKHRRRLTLKPKRIL